MIAWLKTITEKTQKNHRRFTMFVFVIKDHAGNPIEDFDLFILAGKDYKADDLPKGFFQDKQRNRKNINRLTYYINANKMLNITDGKIGFRIVARPQEGVVFYQAAEFRSGNIPIENIVVPNQTVIVEVVMKRNVDKKVFQLDAASEPRKSFKKIKSKPQKIST